MTHDEDWLAGRFEGNRDRLRAMAYRMLGSPGDAEDAVQEAWIRVAGADAGGVANLDGWFTTIVARICLDMLRSRKSRREDPLEADFARTDAGPEQEAVLADSVGLALLVVLDMLAPAERVAFVLHDMFGVPFDEIAGITGRSPDAARQLASRARRRVRGGDSPESTASVARRQAVAEAFLAASRAGDLEGLLAILDPDVVLTADAAVVPSGSGAPRVLRGATAVSKGARLATGRARDSAVALVGGTPGIVWAPGGRLAIVLAFTFAGDKISGIDIIGDPGRLEALELSVPG
jgi:RNA polymerase sigma-70 factor (ECF subfamily)